MDEKQKIICDFLSEENIQTISDNQQFNSTGHRIKPKVFN